MITNIKMFVMVLLIMRVSQFLVYADSPITSTSLYVSSEDWMKN